MSIHINMLDISSGFAYFIVPGYVGTVDFERCRYFSGINSGSHEYL